MVGVWDTYLKLALPVTALLLVSLSGCSAGSVTPSPTAPSAAAIVVPAGGISLIQLGFRNGPAAVITVPKSARIEQRVDQPNVLTATFSRPSGAEIAGWLREHLRDGGFGITADRNGSLVFVGPGWSGAFTSDPQISALTLRKDP